MFGGKSGIALATSFLLLACGTCSVLALMFEEANWKSFTYNFGAWIDEKELGAIVPYKGVCSLILQAGDNVRGPTLCCVIVISDAEAFFAH